MLWFAAWLLGWNERRVLPSSGIFQTPSVKSAPYARQSKNKAPVASYQSCIIFRTGTYFPIQTMIVKNRPGQKQYLKSAFHMPFSFYWGYPIYINYNVASMLFYYRREVLRWQVP
jgi:hypothetical protein